MNRTQVKSNFEKNGVKLSHRFDSLNTNTNLVASEFVQKIKPSRTIFALGIFVIVPIVLIASLLIDYLWHYPIAAESSVKPKNGPFKFTSQTTPSFIITMCLIAVIVAFGICIFCSLRKQAIFDNQKKCWTLASIGFVASFLDTIGIGSYAVSIGLMKATKTDDDDSLFSGTMTVGYCLPQLIEASIFMAGNDVEWQTLLILTACSIVGGLIGSWLSSKINTQVFRLVISILMIAVGVIMVLSNPTVNVIRLLSAGAKGFFVDLQLGKLIGSAAIFIVLGCLSSLGLGMFAPALAALSLLGMQTAYIYPIMNVAASAMMPPAAIKFIKNKEYLNPHAMIFNIVGGIGALCSYVVFFVGVKEYALNNDSELFDNILKWIAAGVVFYSGFLMLSSFITDFKKTGWRQPKADPDLL